MAKYIDPTYDTGFKLVFGRENISNDILVDFLNSIFVGDSELSDIRSVRYLNSEHPGEWSEAKGIRYDIECETGSGHRFIVEMQKSWQIFFLKRSEYYVYKSIARQGYRGKNEFDETWDYAATPTVGVFVCNTHIEGLERKLLSKIRPTDEDTKKPINSLARFVFIQLPYFKKKMGECESEFDKWIYNLKNMGPTQEVAFGSHSEVFRRLASVGNVAALSPEERQWYDADLKRARDYNAEIKGARYLGHKEGLKKGLEKGRKEGLEKGLEKGRKEGLEKGRKEGLEKGLEKGRKDAMAEVIAKLLASGMDEKDIHNILGLN